MIRVRKGYPEVQRTRGCRRVSKASEVPRVDCARQAGILLGAFVARLGSHAADVMGGNAGAQINFKGNLPRMEAANVHQYGMDRISWAACGCRGNILAGFLHTTRCPVTDLDAEQMHVWIHFPGAGKIPACHGGTTERSHVRARYHPRDGDTRGGIDHM